MFRCGDYGGTAGICHKNQLIIKAGETLFLFEKENDIEKINTK